jgi:Ca2+-binding RTX toxin-like protein
MAKPRTIIGTEKDDVLTGGGGADTISGHGGDDIARGGGANDNLTGDAGNDKLYGQNGADWMYGGEGRDTLLGGEGNDIIGGAEVFNDPLQGDGADYLDGGDGADWVYGGAGDTMIGGEGSDLAFFAVNQKQAFKGSFDGILDGGKFKPADIVLKGFEDVNITLTDHNDVARTGDDGLTLYGEGGNDALTGGAGFDWLDGGDDQDTINGGDGVDVLSGRSGDDNIKGGAGGDVIYGDEGHDTLYGGGGADSIYGDFGVTGDGDVFVYKDVSESTATSADIIYDLGSTDVINLTKIDADLTTAGDAAFHRVDAFSGHAGELVSGYDSALGRYFIAGDVNGDGAADLTIYTQAVDPSTFTGLQL